MNGPGLLWQTAAEVCGTVDPVPLKPVAETGTSTMLLRIFQNSRQLMSKGICVIPKKEMAFHQLDRYNMTAAVHGGRIRALFADLISLLEKDISASCQILVRQKIKPLLFCLIMNRLAYTLCLELKRADYPLMETKITLTPIRKLWIAWRSKRKAA